MKLLKIWFGCDEGRKDIELSLEMLPATTLRLLCAGTESVDALCSFLTQAAQMQPEETRTFVTRFLSEIAPKLGLKSLALDIKSGFEGQPSSSWLMLKRFLEGLCSVPHLQQTVQASRSTIPHYVSIP